MNWMRNEQGESEIMIRIQKNIKLAKYTTFHIGGEAEFFAKVRNLDELKKALSSAQKNKLKISILGGGSNVLLPDNGIKGLVIKIDIRGIKFNGSNIYAGSGEVWDSVVAKAVSKKLGGIENLSLIPGTMGGAVYQNIGAYGVELKDVLDSVDVFDIRSSKIKKLSKKDCRFGYRDSIFQKPAGKNYLILGAYLKLFGDNYKFNLNYQDLESYFNGRIPSINDIRKAVIGIRRSKLVYPTKNIGTVGSFFKNPVVVVSNFKTLVSKYPDIKGRDIGGGRVKLSAGQLIERAGWKAKRSGSVGVSAKHALVLVSYKGAKAHDIINLAESIQKSVKDKFGIKLEPEVKIIT